MLQLEGECYSFVELETTWEKETCIHVELGNFIFFPIWFRIVLYINSLFVINEKIEFFLQLSLITIMTKNKVFVVLFVDSLGYCVGDTFAS